MEPDSAPLNGSRMPTDITTAAGGAARHGFGMVPTNPNANKQPTLTDKERWEWFNKKNAIPLSPGYPFWTGLGGGPKGPRCDTHRGRETEAS